MNLSEKRRQISDAGDRGMSEQHEFDPSIPHYGCHACNAEKLQEPVKVTTATPEPSVRALLAQCEACREQLREVMSELRTVADILKAGDKPAIDAAHEVMLALDIGEARRLGAESALAYQSQVMADLAAEMQRFAEAKQPVIARLEQLADDTNIMDYMIIDGERVNTCGAIGGAISALQEQVEQARAWAARLKALQ